MTSDLQNCKIICIVLSHQVILIGDKQPQETNPVHMYIVICLGESPVFESLTANIFWCRFLFLIEMYKKCISYTFKICINEALPTAPGNSWKSSINNLLKKDKN